MKKAGTAGTLAFSALAIASTAGCTYRVFDTYSTPDGQPRPVGVLAPPALASQYVATTAPEFSPLGLNCTTTALFASQQARISFLDQYTLPNFEALANAERLSPTVLHNLKTSCPGTAVGSPDLMVQKQKYMNPTQINLPISTVGEILNRE